MDTDLIDPTRDRVWAVDVTVTYTTYVIAENADEAKTLAEEGSDGDLSSLVTFADYDVSEVVEPVSEAEGFVPWGRAHLDDQELTVNEALLFLASQPTAPPASSSQTADGGSPSGRRP